MNRILLTFILFMCLTAVGASAKTYGVKDIPNVQVADHTRYLSNPDGIVSPMAQARIDTLLADVRAKTSAEIAAVIVDDIDSDDIDTFATELFSEWGIGKRDNSNGILLIVAKDRHDVTIRTGYGAEGVMPDIVAWHIIRDKMFPHFREDDYDGGMIAAVTEMHRIVTDPEAAEELRSELEDAEGPDATDMFNIYLALCVMLAVVMLGILIYKVIKVRGKTDYEKYSSLESMRSIYLALSFLGLAMPLVAAIPLVIMLRYWRNRPRRCKHCRTSMVKVDEVHDNDYLSHSQDIEEQIKSVDYDVWRCPGCGETEIFPFVNKQSIYKECEHCHARTSRLSCTRVLRQPTTTAEGLGQREYSCLNCGHVQLKPYTIAKLAPVVVIGSGGGGKGFGGGGFGGGSFGGGFGGGFTGGGGASGHW